MSKYKCKHCGKVEERDSKKRWIKSYCDETGKDTHMYRCMEWGEEAPPRLNKSKKAFVLRFRGI